MKSRQSPQLVVQCRRCGEVWTAYEDDLVKPCDNCGARVAEQHVSAGPIGDRLLGASYDPRIGMPR